MIHHRKTNNLAFIIEVLRSKVEHNVDLLRKLTQGKKYEKSLDKNNSNQNTKQADQ